MKSPVNNVGIIDEEGILKGSKTKVLTAKTNINTGKKEPICSTVFPKKESLVETFFK